jgi:hypothetical protein
MHRFLTALEIVRRRGLRQHVHGIRESRHPLVLGELAFLYLLAHFLEAGAFGRALPPLEPTDGAGVGDVRFSPPGTRLRLLATGTAGSAWLWDVATGRTIARLPHEGWNFSAAWSPDGAKVATGSRSAPPHAHRRGTHHTVGRPAPVRARRAP